MILFNEVSTWEIIGMSLGKKPDLNDLELESDIDCRIIRINGQDNLKKGDTLYLKDRC